MVVSEGSVVIQRLVDDVPHVRVVHVSYHVLDVLLHECLDTTGTLLLQPIRDPIAILGPNERVSSHCHAMFLGKVLDPIAARVVVVAPATLGNHVHLAARLCRDHVVVLRSDPRIGRIVQVPVVDGGADLGASAFQSTSESVGVALCSQSDIGGVIGLLLVMGNP